MNGYPPTPEHQHYLGGHVHGGRICTHPACWGTLTVDPETQELVKLERPWPAQPIVTTRVCNHSGPPCAACKEQT